MPIAALLPQNLLVCRRHLGDTCLHVVHQLHAPTELLALRAARVKDDHTMDERLVQQRTARNHLVGVPDVAVHQVEGVRDVNGVFGED